jgi:hypothetical protein
MKCEYCNIRESKYITKNGKHCCEKNYQSCPSIREKNSKGLTKSLKEQYDSGKRVSHFKKINDGSFWKGRKHTDETKEKLSKTLIGRVMSEEFRIKRSDEMKFRYSNGWESSAGRTKKIKYISPIAGEVLLDGNWELKTAIYFDENNINWRRNKKRFNYVDLNGKKRTYCPDFYLVDDDLYIEIKGYETELDRSKWGQFTEKIEIWNKSNLKSKKII